MKRGSAPALIYGEETWSYADLLDRSRRAAAALAELGIGRGDKVALWLPNVPAWLALYFALGRLGAVTVAVNTRFRALEVADILSRGPGREGACHVARIQGHRLRRPAGRDRGRRARRP